MKRQRVVNTISKEGLQVVSTEETKKETTSRSEISDQKQRSDHTSTEEPTELPAVATTASDFKIKACTPADAHSKQPPTTNVNTSTSESVGRDSKTELKKASAEQLPANTSPGTTTINEIFPSTSGSSAFKVFNRCLSLRGTSRADFEAKYHQFHLLGEGGFGSVYAGFRKMDSLPVAIKHIPRPGVKHLATVQNGVSYKVPTEVFLQMKVAGPESLGKTAVVSLLDWYDLEKEVLLIMERPMPAVDLLAFLDDNNGPLKEETCKVIMKQLVEAAVQIHSKGVFHRDIKQENILIHSTSGGLRVRVIDFGCGCISSKGPFSTYAGTCAYVPPEFCFYKRYEGSPTTVWQLGAVLYEIIDGYRQFETTTVLREGLEFNDRLSNDCQDLLQRCLTVNPDERITLQQILQHHWFT